MSLENKLTYLNGTKEAIKQAIIDKGVSVTEADTFRSYASKIEEIQSGGSSGDCPKHTLDLTDGVSNSFNITKEIKEIILPSNMDNVIAMSGCFSHCTLLTSITLPELPNVTTMSDCFASCYSLTSITLPSSLPMVSDINSCFDQCSSLTSITLPELPNVTTMGGMFRQCYSLRSITLLELPKVEDMYDTFVFCSKLTSITLPSSLPNVTNMSGCFSNCSSLTSITLLELPNVTTMSSCFNYCYALTSITLPELPNVTTMFYCFNYCYALTSITLPELPNVTNMDTCFYDCSSLENLSIGNINPNITTLTNWGISTCTLLTVDSLVNIMNALPTITSTKTCTIGTTNLSKLSPEQLAIGVNKGWTIN